jgi:hypothetical protein
VGTGLIFAAVVIAWAVFLVPWALRRYDEATRARSVDKFSKTMRLLGRTPRAPAAFDEELEAEAEAVTARRSLKAPQPAEATAEELADRPHAPTRAAARVAAKRRRRVLMLLFGATAIVGALAALMLIPMWSLAIPGGLLLAFLALCRWQVRRADDAIWDSRRATESAHEPDESVASAGRSAAAEDAEGAEGRQAVEADAEPVGDADLAESTAVAVTVSTDDGRSLWDPLPVTLPTYVSKAKATRTVRTIDLGQPDAWTSGHVEGEQTELPSDAATAGSDSESGSGSDSPDGRQRAVGD